MKKIGYEQGSHLRNNVFSFLTSHLERNPDKAVLRWVKPENLANWSFSLGEPLPHEQMTFQEMSVYISRVAQGYLDLGVKYGDRAILFLPMSPQMYISMFALQMIGAIPVFLDSWARRTHLGASAAAVEPVLMVSFEKAFELCAPIPELKNLKFRIVAGPSTQKYDAHLENLMQYNKVATPVAVEQEHTALITFTTGSSGTPKGANRSHRFLAAQHYALNQCIPYQNNDVDLPVFPIFSLNNMAAGVTTVLPAIDVGVPSEKDALILCAQFASAGVNCATLSPSLLNAVTNYSLANKIKLNTLRRTVTGGAPVSRDNVETFKYAAHKSELWVLYGSTEAEPMAEIEAEEMLAMTPPTDPEIAEPGVNVGKIAKGLKTKFLKLNKNPIEVHNVSDWKSLVVPDGEPGEFIVAGEHVCNEYYNNPGAFKKAKIRDCDGTVWHRTGDVGYLDEKNQLWLVGRVHNTILRDGIMHFPVRAEILLRRFSFVKLAAYLGATDAILGEKAICVVVCDTDKTEIRQSRENDIRRIFAKNNLPLDKLIFRAEMPMDPRHHSKVEYDALRTQLGKEGLLS